MEEQIAEMRVQKAELDQRRDSTIKEINALTSEIKDIKQTSIKWNVQTAPHFPPDSDFFLHELPEKNAMFRDLFFKADERREVCIYRLCRTFYMSEALAAQIREREETLAAWHRERDREMYEAHTNAVNYDTGWYADLLNSEENAANAWRLP